MALVQENVFQRHPPGPHEYSGAGLLLPGRGSNDGPTQQQQQGGRTSATGGDPNGALARVPSMARNPPPVSRVPSMARRAPLVPRAVVEQHLANLAPASAPLSVIPPSVLTPDEERRNSNQYASSSAAGSGGGGGGNISPPGGSSGAGPGAAVQRLQQQPSFGRRAGMQKASILHRSSLGGEELGRASPMRQSGGGGGHAPSLMGPTPADAHRTPPPTPPYLGALAVAEAVSGNGAGGGRLSVYANASTLGPPGDILDLLLCPTPGQADHRQSDAAPRTPLGFDTWGAVGGGGGTAAVNRNRALATPEKGSREAFARSAVAAQSQSQSQSQSGPGAARPHVDLDHNPLRNPLTRRALPSRGSLDQGGGSPHTAHGDLHNSHAGAFAHGGPHGDPLYAGNQGGWRDVQLPLSRASVGVVGGGHFAAGAPRLSLGAQQHHPDGGDHYGGMRASHPGAVESLVRPPSHPGLASGLRRSNSANQRGVPPAAALPGGGGGGGRGFQKNMRPSAGVTLGHDLDSIKATAEAEAAAVEMGAEAADEEQGLTSIYGSAASAASLDSMDSFDLGRAADKIKIKIHAVTYNMASTNPGRLPPSVLTTGRDGQADIYVVGSQESCPVTEWEKMLGLQLGDKYVKVASETLMSIHVVLYTRSHLARYIADVRTSFVATGVGNVLGNKGGVALAFTIANAKVLIVAAHLAAHDDQVERRNADFHRIAAGLFADPSESTFKGLDPFAQPTNSPFQSLARPSDQIPHSFPSKTSSIGGDRTTPTGGSLLTAALLNSSPVPEVKSMGVLKMMFGRFGSAPVPSGVLHQAAVIPAHVTTSEPDRGANSGKSRAQVSGPSFTGNSFTHVQHVKAGVVQLEGYDVVLWLGDLNYRINANLESVLHLIERDMIEVLLANDQLKLQQKKSKAFQGFLEQEITFQPTFKYEPHTQKYSGKRVPSWTDRVLYTCNGPKDFVTLKPLYYRAVQDLTTSDHRPVVAGFELVIQPDNHVPPDGVVASKCVIC